MDTVEIKHLALEGNDVSAITSLDVAVGGQSRSITAQGGNHEDSLSTAVRELASIYPNYSINIGDGNYNLNSQSERIVFEILRRYYKSIDKPHQPTRQAAYANPN